MLLVPTVALLGCRFQDASREAGRAATEGAIERLREEYDAIKAEMSAGLKAKASELSTDAQIKLLDAALDRMAKLEASIAELKARIEAKPPSERSAQDWAMLGLLNILATTGVFGVRDKLTARKRELILRAAANGGVKPS